MDRRLFLWLVAGSVVGRGVLTQCRGDDGRPPKPSRILRLEGAAVPSPDGTVAAVSSFDVRPHVLDVESGKVKARLALPATFQAGAEVFSADGSKIAGTGRSDEGTGKQFILVWDASSGKLLHRVAAPDSAVLIWSLCFWGNDVLYAGARNEIYRYDLRTGQLAALGCPVQYYAIDLAVRPDREVVAYADGQGGAEWGLMRWSLAAKKRLPPLFEPGRYKSPEPGNLIQRISIDYSADGSEIATSVTWPDSVPSKVYRFDTATGREVGSAVVPHKINMLRYVGDTRVLLIWGEPNKQRSGGTGAFGFIGADSATIDAWHEAEAWISGKDHVPSISAATADSSSAGHLTVGVAGGAVLQWRREDWPESIDGAITKAPLGGGKYGAESHRPGEVGYETLPADRWRRRPAGRGRQRCQYA